MLTRLAVGLRPSVTDTVGQRVAGKIASELHMPVRFVRIVRIFTIDGLSEDEVRAVADAGVLHDPVVQEASLAPLSPGGDETDWVIEIAYRPGVTDNEARTARETVALALGLSEERRAALAVYTAAQYHV
nr:phosphoribosylformylglycinamidine synthase [Solidesulfovibrio sp.]